MTVDEYAWAEAAARLFEPKTPPWPTPGALAQHIEPTIRQTRALELIDEALVEAYRTPNSRLIISMPPQEGKSQRASRTFPLWALTQNPDTRIVIASFESHAARKFGRAVRDDVKHHSKDLGFRVRDDLSGQIEWELDGYKGGVYSVGVGGALTGRPSDLMIIDDPVKDAADADSETIRDNVWDWWETVAQTRLAPGAPVIVIMTRWHEDDLAGRLIKHAPERWKVVSIPAQCEDPVNDPLGREHGEFMESARGRTTEEWQDRKNNTSTRNWSALYQQNPTPTEGAVWKCPWIEQHRGSSGTWMTHRSRCLVSVDPAATSKKSSDYTGIIVTGLDRHGVGWVLDDRTIKGTPLEWAGAVWDAVCDWQADEIVIEDNQGGEMVTEVLSSAWKPHRKKCVKHHSLPPPVARVHATQSKRTRAESVAVFYEKGHVRHAADGTGRLTKVETQMLTWTGDSKSPDRLDALVHGLTRLFLRQHSTGGMRARTQQHRWAGMRR